MGHLTFLESLLHGYLPLKLLKATLTQVSAAAVLRVQYLTQTLEDCELLECEGSEELVPVEECDLIELHEMSEEEYDSLLHESFR